MLNRTPADRHKGLSQLIVDLHAPGVTVRPIRDLAGDAHFSEIFFDDVQLGDDALIGAEGGGWEQVTAELAFERSGRSASIPASCCSRNGQPGCVASIRRVRVGEASLTLLGRFMAHLAVLRADVDLGHRQAGAGPESG